MPNPLVSTIIPTYNRAYILHRAVDSVLAQTHSRCEVVIVDDGSTDGTAGMVRERYGHDARVRYVQQENAGVSAARNRGFAAAQGDFFALLDSDDWWAPWKLELQLACFRHCPKLGMVWTDMSAVNAEGEVVDRCYLKAMYAAYQHWGEKDLFTDTYAIREVAPQLVDMLPGARLMTGEIFSQMIMGNMVHTSTVLLTRERAERVNGFRVDLVPSGEDYDFHLRTCREGLVGFVDHPSICYQVAMPDQLTARSYSIDFARNFLKTIEPVIERDRELIRLPERMIRHSLAYGHRWLGRELLLSRRSAPARSHLAQSMRQEWSPGAAGLYAMSLLPAGAIDLLRSARKMCFRALRPQQSTN
jgi:GT2 family glycosyltransferase